jgi:hypothetical protein
MLGIDDPRELMRRLNGHFGTGEEDRRSRSRETLKSKMNNSASPPVFPLEGGCACGFVRYRLEARPLIAHCCHCTSCQRETGTAFALNAVAWND